MRYIARRSDTKNDNRRITLTQEQKSWIQRNVWYDYYFDFEEDKIA